ncbi:MAG: hypothetical protein JEZ09_02925 [Salinivirgaceae bacterium]|nr:hypothetical protein [Salinivirgaceae bacterium]
MNLKRLHRNKNTTKQNFERFDKLSAFELHLLRGGTEEQPLENDEGDYNE